MDAREVMRLVLAAPPPPPPPARKVQGPPGFVQDLRRAHAEFEAPRLPPLPPGHAFSLSWQWLLWEAEFLTAHARPGDEVVLAGFGARLGAHLPTLARLFPRLRFHAVDPWAERFLDHPEERPANTTFEVRTFAGEVARPAPRGRRLLVSHAAPQFEGARAHTAEAISEGLRIHHEWAGRLNVAAALIPFMAPPPRTAVRFFDFAMYYPSFGGAGARGSPARAIVWVPGVAAERVFKAERPPRPREEPAGAGECGCAGCARLRELSVPLC